MKMQAMSGPISNTSFPKPENISAAKNERRHRGCAYSHDGAVMTDLKVIDGTGDTSGNVVKLAKPRIKGRRQRRKGNGNDTARLTARLVQSYRDMEPDICDLVTAAEIALDQALQEDVGRCTLFSVDQFQRLADDLKKKYYRAYRD